MGVSAGTVSVCVGQDEKDQQWKRAMDYLSAVSELNYMTQIVIMLYEDNNKVCVTDLMMPLSSMTFILESLNAPCESISE